MDAGSSLTSEDAAPLTKRTPWTPPSPLPHQRRDVRAGAEASRRRRCARQDVPQADRSPRRRRSVAWCWSCCSRPPPPGCSRAPRRRARRPPTHSSAAATVGRAIGLPHPVGQRRPRSRPTAHHRAPSLHPARPRPVARHGSPGSPSATGATWSTTRRSGTRRLCPGRTCTSSSTPCPCPMPACPGRARGSCMPGRAPFTGYKVSDKPADASQMCILVANPDHSIDPGHRELHGLPLRRARALPRSAVGGVELAGVGREPEALAAGQDPAVAELGDGPLGRRPRRTAGAAGAGPRRSPSSRRRTSAGRGSRSRRCAPARASSPGCAGTPRRTIRPPSAAIATKHGVERVRAGRAGGQDQVDRVGPPDEAGHRGLDRLGVVLDVVDGDDLRAETLDLGPDAGLELVARRRADRLLDDDPDPARDERRDPDDRVAAEAGQPRARRRRSAASTRCGATLTLATRSPVSTTWPSNAVKTSSGSIRLSRSSSAIADVEDAGRLGEQVDPALGRAADRSARDRRRPRRDGARRRPRGARRAPARARVTGSPGSAAASAARSSARQPPALRPALRRRSSGRGRGWPRRGARARADPA